MPFLKENYTWIFSGIGVFVISGIIWTIYFVFKKKTKETETIAPVSPISITNTNTVVSANTTYENKNNDESVNKLTRILFVDDNHKEFKIVSILKKSGWINTKSVEDITALDDPKVQESDIIFVYINGVGTTLFDAQGLGLASALKKKYPTKKIVLYSAESQGDRFHKALREVDDCLNKDAEPYQFINLIEEYSIHK